MIVWSSLSLNSSAYTILKMNKEKINYNNLSFNYYNEVINLLKEKPAKINWIGFSQNPYIFEEKK